MLIVSFLSIFLILSILFENCVYSQVTIIPSRDEVLIFDVSRSDISNIIAPLLDVVYLSYSNETFTKQKTGIIWGYGVRSFINLPVRLNNKKCPKQINVIFRVDTAAAFTTLTKQVSDKLYSECPKIDRTNSDQITAQINSRPIQLLKSKSGNMNILGADFLRMNNARLLVDYSLDSKQKVQIFFDANIPLDQ